LTEYIPIIYIFDNYYEVWGVGVRHGRYGGNPNYTLARLCRATSIPLIWHCEKRLEVLYELFRRFRQYGATKVRMCKFDYYKWVCKEVEL
jgi:hypothetical protein